MGGNRDVETAVRFLVDFLSLFPQEEMKLHNAHRFSPLFSRHFLLDKLQLQLPNSMAFFTLQRFVLESSAGEPCF